MKLLEFIKNKSFEQIKQELEQHPYNLIVKDKESLYMLSYNQFDSDFSLDIVRQSRGIILEKETNKIICYAFDKFFNYGEVFASKVDFPNSRVLEKIDGSLIKIFYYNKNWRIATNNTIDARDAMCSDGVNSYYSLVLDSLRDSYSLTFEDLTRDLSRDCTYIFELVHEKDKHIINYLKNNLYVIGIRDNVSLSELDVIAGAISKPRQFAFDTLVNVIDVSKTLGLSQEGYVVVDKCFNRIKLKSNLYVKAHKLYNNGILNDKRICEIIFSGETSEFLNYFPDYKIKFNEFEYKLSLAYNTIDSEWSDILRDMCSLRYSNYTRKDLALRVKDLPYKSVLFDIYDKKSTNAGDWFGRQFALKKYDKTLELVEKIVNE